MYTICPDFNSIGFENNQDVKFANDLKSAQKLAAELTMKYPTGEIYIFRAVRKVKLANQPTVNSYTIDEKGQVLPA